MLDQPKGGVPVPRPPPVDARLASLVARLAALDFFEPDRVAVPLRDLALVDLEPEAPLGLPDFAFRLGLPAVLALAPVARVPDALSADDFLVPFDTGRRAASPAAVADADARTVLRSSTARPCATLRLSISSRFDFSASANAVTNAIAANVEASKLSTDEFSPMTSGPSIPGITPIRITR